ncbi:MAG TPA: hypothetical protein VIX12_01755 [Candidatus Binataceae bacterium]
MASKRVEIELPGELYEDLERVAEATGINGTAEAAMIAVAEWVSRRRSELDDRDPSRRYFVNEALDELDKKKT